MRDKHQLYVQGKLVLVSASDERIRRAIVRATSDLAAEQPQGHLEVRGTIVITADGRAIIVDRRLGHDLWNLDRRLRRHGCRVIDSTVVAIDLATCSAELTHPSDLLADVATISRADSPESDGFDDFRGGAFPVARLVFMGASDGESLSETLAEAAPLTMRSDYTLRAADVERLLEVLRGTEFRAVAPGDAGALLAAIGLSEG